jgi:hypothetical protein
MSLSLLLLFIMIISSSLSAGTVMGVILSDMRVLSLLRALKFESSHAGMDKDGHKSLVTWP